ncbi:amino acid/polyamine/organocation transporter, APC superfamily [Leadbetterella byssophila DSM 17132]|uniref:Amino acid/polyamine/organocation transporter, APC superfamily n=1 Tax=Leadbetterella byssophila (strain DSM 17132 / JCM 16389 / KACC 11308 / NBRC 106382 / 4M15) TaxID=649349 RepID=E4RRW9_LEAB4|nr:amino acid permease [Leadbetterella byssophila]ADQ18501.1 amino acid/polyamine/organocation transporter, APC superfamily [Leadbetterella byssophila DSM 17132]
MGNPLFQRKNIEQAVQDASDESHGPSLERVLSVKDLTFFGLAAIVGAGIFSTIGKATFAGGPAVSLLFIFVAIACVFTALSYAQFASTVPVSGSAYTYAYVTFGEVFAWIIGWALVLEYAVSNIVVAISWSEYFVTMLENVFRIHWPRWLAIDAFTAGKAFDDVLAASTAGTLAELPSHTLQLAKVYESAPVIGGIKVLMNLPAAIITVLITWLIYIGIKESRNVSNLLVYIKLGIVIFVILGGVFYVDTANWTPFAPNGTQGVMLSVAAVFFSFIGFDAISTTAEETKNPQRDLPRAMIYALIVTTVLYVLITLVLTGMVNYKELGVNDPLAFVFEKIGMNWMAGVISVSAVIAISSALLAFQVAQPRIWMVMSRDGLLPKVFGDIHPKYKTPWFSTIVTGVLVAVPAMFLNMEFVIDLTAVGTLFAFILVCGGILYMDHTGLSQQAKFRVPYINGKFLILPLLAVGLYIVYTQVGPEYLNFKVHPLYGIFWLTWAVLGILAFRYNFSLFPVIGILVNLYLMAELGTSNWTMFLIWLVIGMVIYGLYGYRNSKLR